MKTRACAAGLQQLYLWQTSLPNELVVRSGLDALTQAGSGLFCPSVFTSGSISDGDGVSLAPAMPAGPVRSLQKSQAPQENRILVLMLVHEGGGGASPARGVSLHLPMSFKSSQCT